MSIPLVGQGNPLPGDFPYRGQWLLEPRVFLYTPDDPSQSAADAVQFTAWVQPAQDDWSFGFDAAQLAANLGVTMAELLEANRARSLMLENVYADTPTGDGASQKIYEFRLGITTANITVEDLSRLGRA